MRLVEETEAHVIVRGLLLLLLLLLLSGGGAARVAAGSHGGGSGVGVGVGNAVLEGLDLGPRDLGLDGDGENLLVAVDQGVGNRGKGGEVQGQGHSGNSSDGAGEGLEELLLADVQNLGGEGVALVVDLLNGQTVGEGGDVEQVEQGGLGRTNLATGLNELQVGRDFNGTTGNLGGDTESLEERGLAGLHTGVASRDPHIERSDGTGTSGGGNLVVQDLVTDGLEVAVGEDETDVTLDEGQETLVLGGIGDEGLEGTANLEVGDDSVSMRHD